MPETNDEAPGSLVQATHDLLSATKKSLFDIARDTDLPFFWLRSFQAEPRANASATRVQKLYEHLSGKPLKV